VALLGNLTGSSQFFNPNNFYNGVVTTSLRLDKASSAYLYRTPSSGSNRRTFTIAFWYKTSIVFASEAGDQNNPIFYADEPSAGGLFALNVSGQGQGAASDTVNELQYYDYDSADSTDYGLETNSSFSDPSAWYHIVAAFDTTQGTEANRVKFYINGVQRAYTDMNQHHGAVIQNRELNVNQATPHWIGRNIDTTSRYMNGYLADFNFIDGTQYDASYFGEFKNGIWIPKEPSVTYGTNGFRLQFKNTSVGSGSSSTIGADTSGNDNHFTSSGIAASDCAMPDSPENNFATWNPLTIGPQGTLTEGSLKNASFWSSDLSGNASTFFPKSGKWYWEVRIDGASTYPYIGITSQEQLGYGNDYSANGGAFYNIAWRPDGTSVSSGTSLGTITKENIPSFTDGDIISFALDVDARKLWVAENNTYADSGDPANGSGENASWTVDVDVSPFISGYQSQGVGTITNFGQDDTFAGAISSAGNTDGNGIGVFKYAPPSGYLALCSANLPELTIGPNSATQADDHFNTVLWTGNQTARSITGVGFQPDWVWFKPRSDADNHVLIDSSRGGTKYLMSNRTDAETTEAQGISSFDSDGFSIGNWTNINENSQTYVAWNWKANGGTTSSNSDGSATTTVQANTTAGFSIVLYTGTGSTSTFGHGLGAVPKWFFTKTRSHTGDWIVYHAGNTSAPETDFLKLNENNATEDLNTMYNDTAPTSTVFTLSTNGDVNTSGRTQVAYCFAEVDGYSKFGSYVGNGNVDGTFVFTGFRPAWVMLKNTARGADWRINDSTRQHENNVGYSSAHLLLANSNSAEITNEYDIDFLSNGFKLRSSDVYENGSGESFVYMAFAEAPFKYANAR